MSQKKTLALINEIEANFPVKDLVYNGLRIWPILRLTHTYYKRIVPSTNNNQPHLESLFGKSHTKSNTPSNLILNGLVSPIKFNALDKEANRPLEKNVDNVFLGNYNGRRTLINGQYFNETLDSLKHFVDEKSIFLEFSIFDEPKIPRYGQSKVISHLLVKDFIFSEIKTKLILGNKEKTCLKEYKQFIEKRGIKAELNPYFIFRYINRINAYKATFLKLFSEINPKRVFLVCYYTPVLMGAILACNELNIPTIEVQHGVINEIHLMYYGWNNIPKDGYELMPTHFWTWSNKFADYIKSWADTTNRHKVLVGGNPWFTFLKEKDTKAINKEEQEFEQLIKDKKHVVLLSLQLIEDFKKSCLIEAMQKSDPHFFWLIRLHPNFRKFIPEITLFLQKNNCHNFEITFTNKLSIYYLFQKATIQVSFWSTVILEALSYDLHTIVIHPNGLDSFKEYIDKGIFKYTEDASTLIKYIIEDNFAQEKEDKYIEASPDLIRKTLQSLR